VVDKSTNKVQFRRMEKSIQKMSTIGTGFCNRPIAHFFHDQTICIADCENLIIGHSLLIVTSNVQMRIQKGIGPIVYYAASILLRRAFLSRLQAKKPDMNTRDLLSKLLLLTLSSFFVYFSACY
jgi:hypothetical protein